MGHLVEGKSSTRKKMKSADENYLRFTEPLVGTHQQMISVVEIRADLLRQFLSLCEWEYRNQDHEK